MDRAALLIGVQNTGQLTPLKAVLDGVRAMQNWALAQNFSTVETLTDEIEKVTVSALAAAVNKIVDDGPPDQLVVYFAGHGINKVYSEYWLLSDAPLLAFEAVNVTASAELARRCGVKHVVFISDACRTTPESIGAQAVTGAPIFPNVAGARPGSVDQFFATRVGEPAYEIADEKAAAGRFTSAFTDVFTRSLNGIYTELLESRPDTPGTMVLRPWPLNRALPDLLLDELERLGVDLTINQQPDALISSDPTQAWLSEVPTKRSFSLNPPIPTPPSVAERVGAKLTGQDLSTPELIDARDSEQDRSASDYKINATVTRGGSSRGGMAFRPPSIPQRSSPPVEPTVTPASRAVSDIESRLDAAEEQATAIDWASNDLTESRVRVDGAEVVESVAGVDATFIEFADGRCTTLAHIDGSECRAQMRNGELAAVHWQPTHASAGIIPTRASLAAASQLGVLNLGPKQTASIRSQIEGDDLAIEIYLAYADRPSTADADDLFDLGLLAETAGVRSSDGSARAPGFPMLSRGFGLLQALPPDEEAVANRALQLAAHALPSHWSLFDLDAKPILLDLLKR